MVNSGKVSPWINILIAVRDEGELLGRALASVETQTYQRCAVICYGDAMSQGTRETLIKAAATASKEITILDTLEHHGIAHARNVLVSASKRRDPSVYFLWLDADDQLHSKMAIEYVANCISETQCDICIFDLEITKDGIPIEREKLPVRLARDITRHRLLLRQIQERHAGVSSFPSVNLLNAATLGATRAYSGIFADSWVNAASGYIFEDFPQMALLLKAERVAALNAKIVNYCRRTNSLSSNSTISVQHIDRIRQLEAFVTNVDLSDLNVAAAVFDFILWKRSQAESAYLELIGNDLVINAQELATFRRDWDLFENQLMIHIDR